MEWHNKSDMKVYYFFKRNGYKKIAEKMKKDEKAKQNSVIIINNPWNITFKYFCCDYESGYAKAFINRHLSETEKKEIEEFFYIPFVNSMYDCTGSVEHYIYGFYEVPNGTWIYKRVLVDC